MDNAERALEAVKGALADNLAYAITCAIDSGLGTETIRAAFEAVMGHHEAEGPGNAEDVAASEPQMVECNITATSPHDSQVLGICEDEAARDAVDTVLGKGRKIEHVVLDTWLVELADTEVTVLQTQGYLDLAKSPYRIQAEMP